MICEHRLVPPVLLMVKNQHDTKGYHETYNDQQCSACFSQVIKICGYPTNREQVGDDHNGPIVYEMGYNRQTERAGPVEEISEQYSHDHSW